MYPITKQCEFSKGFPRLWGRESSKETGFSVKLSFIDDISRRYGQMKIQMFKNPFDPCEDYPPSHITLIVLGDDFTHVYPAFAPLTRVSIKISLSKVSVSLLS